MKIASFLVVMCMVFCDLKAQPAYTEPQFAYDSLINVAYGTAIGYSGANDTLELDIYKPNGDGNCRRPLIVLVHGGSWVGGSKEDPDLIYMSRALAKRGWVVANINYRLGTHKASNYTMYAFCNSTISAPCAYICDSSEIYRANYRGMQDAKAAIRFMKSRNLLDSTDVDNTFIAGQSAGGFVALAAAFTDDPSEKHISCFEIPDAPQPDADLINFGCIPSSNNRSRPDLGSIEGELNIGTFDASVKGVGNFFGGIMDIGILNQSNAATPFVYMFHQGSDVIVNYDYGRILGRISWECYAQTNLCQSYFFYPDAHGSKAILEDFIAQGIPVTNYQADIVENFLYLNNCLSNGHSIDNIELRLQNMVNLFADKIEDSGNIPAVNCSTTSVNNVKSVIGISIYPNPATENFTIKIDPKMIGITYEIIDITSHTVATGKLTEELSLIKTDKFKAGLYILKLDITGGRFFKIHKL